MKRISIAILVLFAFAFSACHKDDKEPEETAPEGTVDMGIVMQRPDGSKYKVYWATCNLGTSDPDECGDYYCWGEVEPDKPGHGREQYKYGDGSFRVPAGPSSYYSFMYVTRYCPKDKADFWHGDGEPDDRLDYRDYGYEDDAARVVLGGKWRTPTVEEWNALRKNSIFDEVTRYGERFFMFKSKITGKALYLPAAGHCENSVHFDGMDVFSKGYSGYYWASSIDPEYPDAAVVWARTIGGKVMYNEMGTLSRWFGACIRPVLEVDMI